MNLRKTLRVWLITCVFIAAPSLAQEFFDNGAALQTYFNSIKGIGATTTDVNADLIADEADSYWQVGATGAAILGTLPVPGGYVGVEFGVFDATNPAEQVVIYSNASDAVFECHGSNPGAAFAGFGEGVFFGFDDNNVARLVKLGVPGCDTGVTFESRVFGFFIKYEGSTWYSDTSLNADSFDRMAAYDGKDQSVSFGTWVKGLFVFAWEADANAAGTPNADFVDFIVRVDSIATAEPPSDPLGSIGDFVWEDLNRNGVQDTGEPGVEDVTVTLTDCDGNFIADTTTAADGSYLFPNLPAGEYKVTFTKPDGFGFTTANVGEVDDDPANDSDADKTNGMTACITLGLGENNEDIDAGLVKASLGDYVWEDLNGNGIQDNGEPGVGGVTVNLLSNPDGDAKCNSNDEGMMGLTTTTNSAGFYEFTNLDPGDYCVQFVLPSGYDAFTLQDQGENDGLDSDAHPDPGAVNFGRTANANLAAGENDPTLDAGLVKLASLGDFVWFDANGNGIQDDGADSGVGGVLVELLDCSDNAILDSNGDPITTTTDSNGEYGFSGLFPGGYKVRFTAPDGFAFTTAGNDPADPQDSNADPISGTTGCVELESGESDQTVDAGLVDVTASLGDFVWYDINANGIQDDGESGIEGVTVNLLDCNENPILDANNQPITTTTGADGGYLFSGLIPGGYKVQFVQPDGFLPSEPNQGPDDKKDSDAVDGITQCVTLGDNGEDLTLDAGFYKLASLGDFVWFDANGNGIQDDGDNSGASGVTVQLLDCSGNIQQTTTTGINGEYLFANLQPGQYTVKFIAPAGFTFTPSGQGSDDTKDSDANVDGESACITLNFGDNNLTIDAGLVEIPPPDCVLDVDASCVVIPPLTSTFDCSDAKPINTLEMEWNGTVAVDVVAYYGTVGDTVLATREAVKPGDVVTISGFEGAGNDVEWEVFDATTGALLGVSRFHLSCSDSGMNGPEDCGKPQGNSKDDKEGFLNDWLLEGLVGSDFIELQCTPPEPTGFADSCTIETPAGPHCEGKVTAISLRYVGGDCTISNPQDDKAQCLGAGSAGNEVRVRVSDGGSKVYFDSGEANIVVGNVIEATAIAAGENDFGSNTVIEIFSTSGDLVQEVEFHTSCSKPLNLGDQFGAMEVIGLNTTEGGNASLGANVVFSYTVTNLSVESFQGTASDSKGNTKSVNLGPATSSITLVPVEEFVLPGVDGKFTNTLTVTGALTPSGVICPVAQDVVVIERTEPPAPQLACDEIKPITELSMVWKGASAIDVRTAAGQFFSNVQPGNLIRFDVADLGNDVVLTLFDSTTGWEVGTSEFHKSCSDENMDGPEDCDIPQGNNKGDEAGLLNEWGLGAMIGDGGQFTCPALDGADVVGPVTDPGTGGASIVLLESWVDGNKVKMEMENVSDADLFIESIDFTWPTDLGDGDYVLKKMKFDGDFVKDIDKTKFGTEGSIMLSETSSDVPFEDDPNKRKIKSGDKRKLEIEFDGDIEKAGLMIDNTNLTVSITFDDGTIIELNIN